MELTKLSRVTILICASLLLCATGCVSSAKLAEEVPSAHKSFYPAGEGVVLPAEENTNGYWLLSADELKTLMKY